MASSLVYVVFYLYLHACAARPLLFWGEGTSTQIELSIKDVTVAERLIIKQGNFRAGQFTEKSILVPLDKDNYSAVKEAENFQGNMQKREERLTLESPQKTVKSENSNTVEDIVVMDYAQPHRKPPIHNRGN